MNNRASENFDFLAFVVFLPLSYVYVQFHYSCQGAGTDEHALIEILVTRSNAEIQAMNAAYQAGEFDTEIALNFPLKPFTCPLSCADIHSL